MTNPERVPIVSLMIERHYRLPEPLLDALKALSKETDVCETELVRQAVREFVERYHSKNLALLILPSLYSLAKFS